MSDMAAVEWKDIPEDIRKIAEEIDAKYVGYEGASPLEVARVIYAERQRGAADGIGRFVAVRFFLPGAGSTVEVYDRDEPNDREAWDKNQQLYRCQVIGCAAEREILPDEGRHFNQGGDAVREAEK